MQSTDIETTSSTSAKVKKGGMLLALLLLLANLGLLVWANATIIVPLKELDKPNFGNDMGYFWTASRTVWQGGSPYLATPGSIYHEVRLAVGGDPTMLDPFKSPHYLTLLFAPLAALPLDWAATSWLVTLQVMLGASVVLIIKLAQASITPLDFLLGILIALLWRYSLLVMIVGNLTPLLLFATAASYYCSRTNRPRLAGAAAALLLVKPQVAFLILPLLLVVPTLSPTLSKEGKESRTRVSWLNLPTYQRWQGFGLIALVFAVYSFGLSPGWVGEWFQTIFGSDTAYINNRAIENEVTSLRGVVAAFVTDKTLVLPLTIALGVPFWVFLGGLWWLNRSKPQSFPYLLSLAIAFNLLTTPYARDYDSGLLLFGLLFCYFTLRQQETKQKSWWRWSWLCWLLAFAPYQIHSFALQSSQALETLVPFSIMVLTLLVWWNSSFSERTTFGKESVAGA